jgi:CNT family concentrative nucleoside transporter
MNQAARFKGLIGYALIIAGCYAGSRNRREIRWRAVGAGLGLQLALGLIVLNPVVSRFFFDVVDHAVRALLGFAGSGIEFVFQSTVEHQLSFVEGGQLVTQSFVGRMSPALKCFAFWALPPVIFFSALIAVLYHLGVMQRVVRGMARLMVHTLGTSGSETLSCTANIFVGATEAPLVVRPFVDKMTQSELMAVMTGGFATVAGGMLAVYVGLLADVPGIAGHLVTASLMAAPCALAVAKLLYPETEQSLTAGAVQLEIEREDANLIEAAARGATDGMTLVLNIVAMLIAFVGLLALVNAAIGAVGALFGLEHFDLPLLLGWLLSPLAWAIGAPWSEASELGQLLGTKLVLTELIAYLRLRELTGAGALSRRGAVIASYALCGFANVPTIGIQIGGIGGMAPSRRGDLARLGLRAMFAGALVSCLSGAIAGILV